ncbi:MAG: tetratricopeptide repeat protein [Candidatus Sulfotelmatobacter sp.]
MLFERKDRRVLPRWRDFRTTLALGELQNSKEAEPISSEDRDAIARRVEEFQIDRDIWHAADLLSSAFVVGDQENADLARNFILSNRDGAPEALISFASGASGISRDFSSLKEDAQQGVIHKVRARLRGEPRNAILWVELARLYTVQGDSRRALRSMTTAASLAPDSRFVVRSAARLFLHEHDAPMALKIIRNAAGAKRDPWLLAAEIATASASRSPALFAKIGIKRNEDDNVSPFARTELSSALGTLEMESGRLRKARQLFRKSLEGPNENSVAQVEWASRTVGGLEIGKELLTLPKTFEVSANLSLHAGDWKYAVAEGMEWLRDQPFSKQPVLFTSYVASLIEDYDKSISILKQSLRTNPDDPGLINNLAFALGSADRLDEAESALKRIDMANCEGLSAITLAATTGLLLFRAGFPDRGRELYGLAISRASARGILKYRVMASLYLAREELIASTHAAETAVNRALVDASKIDDKEVAFIAEQVRNLEASLKSKATLQQGSGPGAAALKPTQAHKPHF